MFRFTSPTQPTLRVLYLIAVEGLSNNGLLNFLLQVSPTLTDLFIINCTLPRSTDDEEFAIDAVIPKMLRLKAMQTVGPGLLSVSAIARKSRENIHSLETFFSCEDAGFDVSGLIVALKATDWQHVTISGFIANRGWDAEFSEEAYKVAADRGLDFKIRI